jgi:DNA (cytosine-5)-methyltransferase 1|tara:strand:+ start:2698 stop:3825 length:1128 start_codon:yes stop_codon:yes gene_type:complete
MKPIKSIDLFSGIGGFKVAQEIVGGFETAQFVENDPYCQKVLKKHWPHIPIHDDIRTFEPELHSAQLVVGGFPCTDISQAGRRAGITKETRSGLFFELMRVVRMVSPDYIVLENVAAILNNGLDIVLGELSEGGYFAEWSTFRASDTVQACHHRDRWFLVAYKGSLADPNYNGSPSSEKSRSIKKTDGGAEKRKNETCQSQGGSESRDTETVQINATDPDSLQRLDVLRQESEQREEAQQGLGNGSDRSDSSHPDRQRLERRFTGVKQELQEAGQLGQKNPLRSTDTNGSGTQGNSQGMGSSLWKNAFFYSEKRRTLNPNWRGYVSSAVLCRGNDGLRGRTYRLRALGNAVIPACAAIPLQRVKDIHEQLTSVDR